MTPNRHMEVDRHSQVSTHHFPLCPSPVVSQPEQTQADPNRPDPRALHAGRNGVEATDS